MVDVICSRGETLEISVVISTHNRHESLNKLLTSLSNQTLSSCKFEVIVVDSPSGNDCSGVISATTNPTFTPRLILTKNVLSAKRNAGALSAKGHILVFLDDDMEVTENFLEMHLAAHKDPSTVISGGILFPPAWVEQSNYYRYKAMRHRTSKLLSKTDSHRFVAMNFSISREEFIKSRGFDESFTGYGGEDVEYGIRLAELGLRHEMCSEASAIHAEVRMSPSSFAQKIQKAALWTPHLISVAPESINIKTIRLTEPNIHRTFFESIIYLLLAVTAKAKVGNITAWYLDKTDSYKFMYAPLLFQFLTLVSTRQGIYERKRIQNKNFS